MYASSVSSSVIQTALGYKPASATDLDISIYDVTSTQNSTNGDTLSFENHRGDFTNIIINNAKNAAQLGGKAASNYITGSGTSGYLTKFNGTNSITNAIALSSSNTNKFLAENGIWEYPKFIQTQYQQNTNFYGTSYPIYAKWVASNICKWTVDNYKTKVDLADSAATADNATQLNGQAASYYSYTLSKSGSSIKLVRGDGTTVSTITDTDTNTTYTAGEGISIVNGVISVSFADGDGGSY